MGKESAFKQKKRGGLDAPTFHKLNEVMNQGGGGYDQGKPANGLSAQMNQASGGYARGEAVHGLRKQMCQ